MFSSYSSFENDFIMSETRVPFATSFGLNGNKNNSRFTQLINFKRNINGDDDGDDATISSSYIEYNAIANTQQQHQQQTIKINYKNNHINTSNKIDKYNKPGDDGKTVQTHKIDQIKIQSNFNNKLNNNNNNDISYTSHINKNRGRTNRNSQCFIRQSVCLYAVSGFLIALCYLAIPAAASIDSMHPM